MTVPLRPNGPAFSSGQARWAEQRESFGTLICRQIADEIREEKGRGAVFPGLFPGARARDNQHAAAERHRPARAFVYENIQTATPFIRPFPAFDDVFGEPSALHRKHFLPLVSVDVSVIYDDLDGWLHFVTPIEPLLELDVGYFTKQHHDFYNQEGQFAFQVAEGKYSFAGAPNYFAYESGAIFKVFPGKEAEIEEDYRVRVSSYEKNRLGYAKCGRIPWSCYSESEPSEDSCGPLVSKLGGEPILGNWVRAGLPRNRSGQLFRYIGEVQGFSYCEGGIQAISLFYDPGEGIALFRTDYT